MPGEIKTKDQMISEWGITDPFDRFQNLVVSLGGNRWTSVAAITFASATQTLLTVPANSIILNTKVIRTTAWDAITTFEVGKSGNTNWLCTTVQANVNAAVDAGEDGNVETVNNDKVVTTAVAVLLTLNQGGAAAGVGYVLVEYQELA